MSCSKQVWLSFLIILATCGCSGLPDAAKLDADGKAFASKVMDEQKPHWNAQAIENYLPGHQTNEADLEKLVQRYSEAMGEPISISKFEGPYRVQAGFNVPDYQGAYKADLTCTKGKGTVNVSVLHKDGKWFLINFNVVSPELAPKDKEREAFVKEVANTICQNWHTEDLNNYGTKFFQKQFEKAELPMKALFAGGRALGTFRAVREPKFLGIGEYQGTDTFSYEVISDYEKGSAQMMITVAKDGQEWRLAGFQVQARTGRQKA